MSNDHQNDNEFSINFTVPEIITPKEIFSSKDEFQTEWCDMLDKVFPNEVDAEKESFTSLPLNEVNCNGSNFEFVLDETNLKDEDIKIIAYMMARAVQEEHGVPKTKIDIDIIQKEITTKVNF